MTQDALMIPGGNTLNEKIKALKAAFPYTIPVLTGFLFLGIAYGVLMSTKGYGAGWSFLMSLIAYCGSMQFVAITLLTTVFNPFQAFLLSVMVNARQLFYGISMLEKYKGVGKLKPFLIYTLCDETFFTNYTIEPAKGINKTYFYFFVSLLNYSYWAIGSLLGGLAGSLIKFDTKGLDFVLTAFFVVIFINQWKSVKNHFPAIIGILSSIVCLIIFGASNFIIPSMLAIMIVLMIFRKKTDMEGM
jgi:4-azaleucine resistance transporter AzlC